MLAICTGLNRQTQDLVEALKAAQKRAEGQVLALPGPRSSEPPLELAVQLHHVPVPINPRRRRLVLQDSDHILRIQVRLLPQVLQRIGLKGEAYRSYFSTFYFLRQVALKYIL